MYKNLRDFINDFFAMHDIMFLCHPDLLQSYNIWLEITHVSESWHGALCTSCFMTQKHQLDYGVVAHLKTKS